MTLREYQDSGGATCICAARTADHKRWPRQRDSSGVVCVVSLWMWSTFVRSTDTVDTVTIVRGDIESQTGVGIRQPRRYVDVGTQVSGQIQRIFVQPGDNKKGQLLAEIDPSLPRAKADADRARAHRSEIPISRSAGTAHSRGSSTLGCSNWPSESDPRGGRADCAGTAGCSQDRSTQSADRSDAVHLKGDKAQLGYTRIYAPMAGIVVSPRRVRARR